MLTNDIVSLLYHINVPRKMCGFYMTRLYYMHKDKYMQMFPYMLKRIYKRRDYYKYNKSNPDCSVVDGYLELVKWMYLNMPETITNNSIIYAARYGHLDVLKYLYSINKPLSIDALNQAIRGNHIHVVKWILNNSNYIVGNNMVRYAIGRGYLDLVKCFCKN